MFSPESIERLKRSIEKGAPLSGPSDVQILPTPRCNASCVFCPINAIPAPLADRAPRFSMYKNDLSGGLLDRLADELYHLGGLRRLTITGGEPLLYRFFIPAVFQFTRSFPDSELTVVTNGIRLKIFAAFLARAGVHNVTVSINAGTDESYQAQNPGAPGDAFEQIVEGVTALTRERKRAGVDVPRVTLSVVLTRASAGDTAALLELGKNTGADAVTFLPLMEIRIDGQSVNRGLKVEPGQFERFIDDVARCGEEAREHGFYLGYAGSAEDNGAISDNGLYRSQPCYAGHTFAAIYPNGDVRPCCHCETVMGNLGENSFSEIWHSEKYRRQREKMLHIAESGGSIDGCLCGECGYLYENREFHEKLEGR